jgi:HlyD family secretion protein
MATASRRASPPREGKDVIKITAGALFRKSPEIWAVFIADSEVARTREVKPGQSNGIETEILEGLEGLQPGEKVLLHPSDHIADRVKVGAR